MKNAGKISNCIQKILYGVKRLDRPDKYEMPNFYFMHEQGKTLTQYHTHIVLPECKYDREEIEDIFNTSIRERCKCISRWKRIDVSEVNSNDAYAVMGYVNKQTGAFTIQKTQSRHFALDPINSKPIIN